MHIKQKKKSKFVHTKVYNRSAESPRGHSTFNIYIDIYSLEKSSVSNRLGITAHSKRERERHYKAAEQFSCALVTVQGQGVLIIF